MHHTPSADEVRKHLKVYLGVFVALMFLTVVTVAISYVHLPIHYALPLGLFVALIKGALVAGFFMHLISETKAIYWTLILTVFFFLTLLLIPVLTTVDALKGFHVA